MPIKPFDASGQVNTPRPIIGGVSAPNLPIGMDTGLGDVARGMGQLGAALADIQMKREEARKADDFAIAKVGIEKGLMELEAEFAEDDAPETAPQRFQDRAFKFKSDFLAGIADTDVQQRVKPLLELAVARQDIAIRQQAAKRETAKRTALLDNDTDFYMNKAVTAEDPAGAVQEFGLRLQGMAPFLGPEETQKRFNQFGEDVEFYRGRNTLRQAGGDPSVLADMLSRMPDLSPRRRDELVEFADTERRASQARYEKAERDAEKALKDVQDATYLDRLERIEAGAYTTEQYQDDKRAGRLSLSQLGSVLKSISGGSATKDDPEVIIRLEQAIARGEDVTRDVEASLRSGRLTTATGRGYLRKDEETGPLGSTAYRDAKSVLGTFYTQGQSVFDKFDTGKNERYVGAILELRNRTMAGEKPLDVLNSLMSKENGRNAGAAAPKTSEQLQEDLAAINDKTFPDPTARATAYAAKQAEIQRTKAREEAQAKAKGTAQ